MTRPSDPLVDLIEGRPDPLSIAVAEYQARIASLEERVEELLAEVATLQKLNGDL